MRKEILQLLSPKPKKFQGDEHTYKFLEKLLNLKFKKQQEVEDAIKFSLFRKNKCGYTEALKLVKQHLKPFYIQYIIEKKIKQRKEQKLQK